MPNKPERKKKPWQQERVPFGRRAVNNSKFYNSTKWRNIANSHKKRNPFCIKCKEKNKISATEFTDHIVRIQDGGDPYKDSNLQSLCAFHHNQKSGKEAHGYKEGMG